MIPTEEEKRQKETQVDQLMDALSNIHPKYIEEARQAVSSKNSRFSGFFVIRTAVVSCLILLVVTAGFRSGMFFDLIGLGGSSGSSENTSLLSNISTESDQMLSGNCFDPKDAQNEGAAAEISPNFAAGEKSTYSSDRSDTEGTDSQLSASETKAEAEMQSIEKSLGEAYATTPPELTLNNSSDTASNNTEKEFSILGTSNGYSWTYPNEDGTNTSLIACADSDIWSCSDLPVLALQVGDSVTLQFSENEPDSLTIHYLPASAVAESSQEDTDSKNSGKSGSDQETSSLEKQIREIILSQNDRFQLPEEKGIYIVEIQAFWDNEIYKGNCTYGLQVQYEEP